VPVGRARLLAFSTVFAGLVFAATLVSVSFPATGGYFNLGESMVYTAAVLGGPLVGAVAGGLGSALADVYLGYAQYAPGTLVIKGAEGFIVGLVYEYLRRLGRDQLRRVGFLAAVAAGAGLAAAGYYYGVYYGRPVELGLAGKATITLELHPAVWVLASLLVAGLILYATRRWDPSMAAAVVSMYAGGAVMVLGYFLYEALVLGLGMTALAEVPINVGQVIVGSGIATTVIAAVRSAEA